MDPPEGTGSIAIDRWNAIETTVKLRERGPRGRAVRPGLRVDVGTVQGTGAPGALQRLPPRRPSVLRQHAKVCAIDSDPAGNIKPSKEGSSQRIDGVAGTVMALGIALRDQGEPEESIYEKLARERAEAA
jgi:hypothetical protein